MTFVNKMLVGIVDSKMKPNLESSFKGDSFVPVCQSTFGFLTDFC